MYRGLSMTLEIFHQLGFRYSWNFQSLENDNTGKGVIISPRHMDISFVEGLSNETKQAAIFDPQFFIPGTQKGKLSTYEFFPDVISNGFDTNEFVTSVAPECALNCLDFQIRNNFRYIVIPTRYIPGVPEDFIPFQQEQFINPFLEAISDQGVTDNVVIELVLNSHMLRNREFTADLLNWITGISSIAGIYLITELSPRSKQVDNVEFLNSILNFVHVLNENDLDVILGYLNTEAIILSVANPRIVTIGSYENTRMFNSDNFSEAEQGRKMGPKARLYFTKLLNWVDYDYLDAIQRVVQDQENFFDENEYQAMLFQPEYNWHFGKPEPYKHYFLEIYNQLNSLANIVGVDRYNAITEMINTAISNYSLLNERGIVFDSINGDSHLYRWQTAINQFASSMGWR
jgi:hypothetical protein